MGDCIATLLKRWREPEHLAAGYAGNRGGVEAMPTIEDIRLGQIAVAQGLCMQIEIEEALREQAEEEEKGNYEKLGEILVLRGCITRRQLERLLALQREVAAKVTKLGSYELIQKLGEGGMGAVYKAKDIRTGEMVALKVLPRSKAKDKAFLKRFEQEARAAFELDHPNIVRGLDIGEADGYHFLVMEYVDGKDVYSMLQEKGRFSESEALNVLRQMGDALEHIHGEHLVHRDIKPENIILKADGTAKLADMGLAVDKEIHAKRRITKAGVAMGTPFYLSPEQVQGEEEIDIRSDLYSLGATIYEMVTGKPPFEGETAAVVMLKHLHEQVPSPHDIDRQISIGFCHIIEKLMAKNPDDRYRTPAELVEDVKAVQAGNPPLSERVPEGRSSVRRPAGMASGRSGQSGFNRSVESHAQGNVQGSATPPFAMRAAESPKRQSSYISSGRQIGSRISLSLLILLIVLGATAAISIAALIIVIFAKTTF